MVMMVPWYCDGAGQEYWRYRRAFSPGLQEFIEAVSFLHYIKHAALITREEVEEVIRAGTPNVLAHAAVAALLVWSVFRGSRLCLVACSTSRSSSTTRTTCWASPVSSDR